MRGKYILGGVVGASFRGEIARGLGEGPKGRRVVQESSRKSKSQTLGKKEVW